MAESRISTVGKLLITLNNLVEYSNGLRSSQRYIVKSIKEYSYFNLHKITDRDEFIRRTIYRGFNHNEYQTSWDVDMEEFKQNQLGTYICMRTACIEFGNFLQFKQFIDCVEYIIVSNDTVQHVIPGDIIRVWMKNSAIPHTSIPLSEILYPMTFNNQDLPCIRKVDVVYHHPNLINMQLTVNTIVYRALNDELTRPMKLINRIFKYDYEEKKAENQTAMVMNRHSNRCLNYMIISIDGDDPLDYVTIKWNKGKKINVSSKLMSSGIPSAIGYNMNLKQGRTYYILFISKFCDVFDNKTKIDKVNHSMVESGDDGFVEFIFKTPYTGNVRLTKVYNNYIQTNTSIDGYQTDRLLVY